jgi:hypothetical protein
MLGVELVQLLQVEHGQVAAREEEDALVEAVTRMEGTTIWEPPRSAVALSRR